MKIRLKGIEKDSGGGEDILLILSSRGSEPAYTPYDVSKWGLNGLTRISVIVPVYNGERYIAECIESIQKQDYKNLEIIAVDDGSYDSSLQILQQYASKDNRIKVIAKENGGVSSARNAGLDIMSGDYLCLIDQDDCIAPDYVSYLLRLMIQNDTQIATVPQAKRFVGKWGISVEDTEDYTEVLSGREAARQMLYYNFIIAPWNKMISTELLRNNRLRFVEEIWGGEGFLFSVECFQRAEKVAVGHKKIYYYRCDNRDSGMTRFNEWILYSSLRAQQLIMNRIADGDRGLTEACEYANWHTNCDMLSYLVGCNAVSSHYDTYRTIRKTCRRKARYAFRAPISVKEKLKAVTYMLSPNLAVAMINKCRLRKYSRID
ncbi:MAG: glycosyltransferase [Muribaculum sp.]|nr:glycosyltransferase [Muribaculum sp.]